MEQKDSKSDIVDILLPEYRYIEVLKWDPAKPTVPVKELVMAHGLFTEHGTLVLTIYVKLDAMTVVPRHIRGFAPHTWIGFEDITAKMAPAGKSIN